MVQGRQRAEIESTSGLVREGNAPRAELRAVRRIDKSCHLSTCATRSSQSRPPSAAVALIPASLVLAAKHGQARHRERMACATELRRPSRRELGRGFRLRACMAKTELLCSNSSLWQLSLQCLDEPASLRRAAATLQSRKTQKREFHVLWGRSALSLHERSSSVASCVLPVPVCNVRNSSLHSSPTGPSLVSSICSRP